MKDKKQKTIGNKGFSLVELIIVIAIMAILVGVMAPQLLKYVERSRESADKQVADTVRTAIVTAMLDPEVTDAPTSGVSGATLTEVLALSTSPKFAAAVQETLNGSTAAQVNAELKSKAYQVTDSSSDKFAITINGTKVTVVLKANSDSGASDFTID